MNDVGPAAGTAAVEVTEDAVAGADAAATLDGVAATAVAGPAAAARWAHHISELAILEYQRDKHSPAGVYFSSPTLLCILIHIQRPHLYISRKNLRHMDKSIMKQLNLKYTYRGEGGLKQMHC